MTRLFGALLFAVMTFDNAAHAADSETEQLKRLVAIQQAALARLQADVRDLQAARKQTILHVPTGFNGWHNQSPGQEPWIDTNININGSHGGASYLLLCSNNIGSGNATHSSVHLVRAGFDGNNYGFTDMAQSNGNVITANQLTPGGTLQVRLRAGNSQCSVITNK